MATGEVGVEAEVGEKEEALGGVLARMGVGSGSRLLKKWGVMAMKLPCKSAW
jgi:hypothetical protein